MARRAFAIRPAPLLSTAAIPISAFASARIAIIAPPPVSVRRLGFAPAEQFAKEKGCGLIRTGGSVITAALDAVLCLGAAEGIFVGLDLAFTAPPVSVRRLRFCLPEARLPRTGFPDARQLRLTEIRPIIKTVQ